MTDQKEPSDQSELPDQNETPDLPPPGPGRARIVLRVSMVVMALGVLAFAYLTPVWMDRGVTKVNADRLRIIAENTAQMVSKNDWSAKQGIEFAQSQNKLGKLQTVVDITISSLEVTVHISGTAISANPFATLIGADAVNHIEVSHTLKK